MHHYTTLYALNKQCIPFLSSAPCCHYYHYIENVQTAHSTHCVNSTHPADYLEEALWQFARLSLQQRNIWIHSKQPQLPVFLHAVKSWAIKRKWALHSNQYQCQITELKYHNIEWVECVVISPSDSSLRKLFGMSGCIMSPPTENTVFMVSMNHSLSGAYV